MKAAQYDNYGESDAIQIKEIDQPVPKEGQVLVAVKAAAINPFDNKLRQGIMKDKIPLQFPVTIGADFAGIVSQVPVDVTNYKVGDEVFGSALILNGGSGAVAENASANIKNIALKPSNASFEEAAAIVLVGVSAIQALDQLNLAGGDKKILIHGGAGGIGTAAIQYAKSLGVYIATTARGSDKDYVTNLGADEVIDYETQKFEDILHDYDAVFDTVGGDTYTRSFLVLRKNGGSILSTVEQPNEQLMAEHGVTALILSAIVNTENLNRLAELVNEGTIKPQIDKVFTLEQTAEAFEHLQSGFPKGKVIIGIN